MKQKLSNLLIIKSYRYYYSLIRYFGLHIEVSLREEVSRDAFTFDYREKPSKA
jgi:hypothetical protein